ncbi:MAG: hypothetical protein ACLQE9_10345 [Roseiarcus sp.]
MVPDMSAIAQAFTALNGVKTIAQGMISLRDTALISGKVVELNGKIIEAQNAIFAIQSERSTLVQRINELEKQIVQLEAWDTDKQKYELKNLGGNALAYMLKPEARGSEPPHWVCTNCYGDRRISIIQRTTGNVHMCPKCRELIRPDLGSGQPKWLD